MVVTAVPGQLQNTRSSTCGRSLLADDAMCMALTSLTLWSNSRTSRMV